MTRAVWIATRGQRVAIVLRIALGLVGMGLDGELRDYLGRVARRAT